MELAKKNLVLLKLFKDYGTAYHSYLTSFFTDNPYPSDLCDDLIKCEYILSCLSPETQLLVSLLSIEKIKADSSMFRMSSAALHIAREDVIDGVVSPLVANSDGTVHRCVRISSLQL